MRRRVAVLSECRSFNVSVDSDMAGEVEVRCPPRGARARRVHVLPAAKRRELKSCPAPMAAVAIQQHVDGRPPRGKPD